MLFLCAVGDLQTHTKLDLAVDGYRLTILRTVSAEC